MQELKPLYKKIQGIDLGDLVEVLAGREFERIGDCCSSKK